VAPGSREENASKQSLEPGSDSIRTDQAPAARGKKTIGTETDGTIIT
jgi:hypothetical protein